MKKNIGIRLKNNSLFSNHLFLSRYNTDNMYTSFKGFQLVGIWQEKPEIIVITDIKKPEIIVITDIKQKIVIIQVIVLQRFSYYRQIGITPTQSSNRASATYHSRLC